MDGDPAYWQPAREQVTRYQDADMILLNTCHIREKAAEKVYSELGRFKGLKAEKPDLICLDLQMPKEWGPRFYRKLRKDKELKDTPIIVVSGIDGDHAIKDAVAFVKKPFDPEKLVGIVKNTIG